MPWVGSPTPSKSTEALDCLMRASTACRRDSDDAGSNAIASWAIQFSSEGNVFIERAKMARHKRPILAAEDVGILANSATGGNWPAARTSEESSGSAASRARQ